MTTIADPRLKETVAHESTTILIGYLEQKAKQADNIDAGYHTLVSAMLRLARSGGKRFRPYMISLSYEACGGGDFRDILPVATAQELLHLSMLIHDDIIDRDTLRYGTENIIGQYLRTYDQLTTNKTQQLHLANSAALLAGDLGLSGAYEMILESNLSDTQKIKACKQLGSGIFNMIGGELLDTESALYPIEQTNPAAIAKYKTASYTFVSPLLIGAELAGASLETISLLRQFGESVGIAFQYADDILGIFGDETITGKSNKGDIKEGKRTYLMQRTIELANEDNQKTILRILGNPEATNGDIDTVRFIIEQSAALQRTEQEINSLAESATKILSELQLQPSYHQLFLDVINAATKRSY